MKCSWPKKPESSNGLPEKNMTLRWEYQCATCQTKFSVEVPKGPTQEKSLRCPSCGSPDIVKTTVYRMNESACGG